MEYISDASFFGKLFVLPAIDRKVIASYKHSSLFGNVIRDEEKKFYNIDPWGLHYKTFYDHNLQIFVIS